MVNSKQTLDAAYVGEIINLEDPLRLGRIKVRIYGLQDRLEENDLPWAQLQLGLGSGINRGTLPVLKVGDRVQVRFLDGDSRYPVVVGSAHAAPDGEVLLPAIGINGFRSTAGVRTTPSELPSSQTINVPYLSDEVSLQHDILIQRRANRSYRVVQMVQGTQLEMTQAGDFTLHGPQSLWLSSSGVLQERYNTLESKGRRGKFEVDEVFEISAGKLDLSIAGRTEINGGGPLSVTGSTISITSMDSVGTVAIGGITQVSGRSYEILGGTGISLTAATMNIDLSTVVGGITAQATPIGPKMSLSPLTGVGFSSPLGTLDMGLTGNVKLASPLSSLEMGITGEVSLSTPVASLDMNVAGGVELKNQIGKVEINTAGQIKISNQMESLGRIMQDLLIELQQLTVQTGTGKSSPPNNLMQLQAVARRLQMLLQS